MQPLRFSINITLDGCCDHRAGVASVALHRHVTANIARADGILFGRVTYQMMEAAWRRPGGVMVSGGEAWMEPFAKTMDEARKYVVSSTLKHVDWNAELVRGDLQPAVESLKRRPGRGIFVAGVRLAMALAELGLIDEYEFLIHPRLAGHGPSLFAGLSKYIDLKPTGQLPLGDGVVVMRYERAS
jgi:dihydrofolate reductase